MGTTPPEKTQLNIYIPVELDEYVASVKDATGITKSDFIHLLVALAKENYSFEDIKHMSDRMLIFGEKGLAGETCPS